MENNVENVAFDFSKEGLLVFGEKVRKYLHLPYKAIASAKKRM